MSKYIFNYSKTDNYTENGNLWVSQLIHKWEQFKSVADDAEKLFHKEGKSFLAYSYGMKIFYATQSPRKEDAASEIQVDKIILSFGEWEDDFNNIQSLSQIDLVTSFDGWCNYNADKIEG